MSVYHGIVDVCRVTHTGRGQSDFQTQSFTTTIVTLARWGFSIQSSIVHSVHRVVPATFLPSTRQTLRTIVVCALQIPSPWAGSPDARNVPIICKHPSAAVRCKTALAMQATRVITVDIAQSVWLENTRFSQEMRLVTCVDRELFQPRLLLIRVLYAHCVHNIQTHHRLATNEPTAFVTLDTRVVSKVRASENYTCICMSLHIK